MSLNWSLKDGKSQDLLCGPGVKRLHGPKTVGVGSIPGQETEIPRAMRHGQKFKIGNLKFQNK